MAGGRLAEVRQNPGNTLVARYTYDALDRLLVVERASGRIRFRYAGTTTAVAQVVDDVSGSVIRNVTVGPEGTVLGDWLGTDRRLYGVNGHHDTTWTANDAGTVTATMRYDPWGNLIASSGSLPDWRFQGSWADTSTSLAWSVARWYDPAQGTFITEDTLLGEPESPASRHLYAYAIGDPVGGWDPSGTETQSVQPNPAELALCMVRSLHECKEWMRDSAIALAITKAAFKDYWERNAHRHCIWQCLLTIDLGAKKASEWGWAHEVGVNKDEFNKYDFMVDLHNNAVGRDLGHFIKWWGFPGLEVPLAVHYCRRAWRLGDLWVAKPKARQILTSTGRVMIQYGR